jgi:hypothetical protein
MVYRFGAFELKTGPGELRRGTTPRLLSLSKPLREEVMNLSAPSRRRLGRTSRRQPAPHQDYEKGLVARACGVILVLAIAVGDRLLLKPRPETKAVPLNPVPLTAALGWESHPSLSPDGNQVAYSRRERREAVSHVYMKLIGEGKLVQLTSGPAPTRARLGLRTAA